MENNNKINKNIWKIEKLENIKTYCEISII